MPRKSKRDDSNQEDSPMFGKTAEADMPTDEQVPGEAAFGQYDLDGNFIEQPGDQVPEGEQASEGEQAPASNGKRSYTKASEKYTLPTALGTAEDTPEDEVIPYSTDKGTRDEVQQTVDADVKAAYDKWVEQEKPKPNSTWTNIPSKRYVVSPEEVDGVHWMLDRAANFHGVAVRKAPARDHQNGGKIVQFWATDKRKRTTKVKADATT